MAIPSSAEKGKLDVKAIGESSGAAAGAKFYRRSTHFFELADAHEKPQFRGLQALALYIVHLGTVDRDNSGEPKPKLSSIIRSNAHLQAICLILVGWCWHASTLKLWGSSISATIPRACPLPIEPFLQGLRLWPVRWPAESSGHSCFMYVASCHLSIFSRLSFLTGRSANWKIISFGENFEDVHSKPSFADNALSPAISQSPRHVHSTSTIATLDSIQTSLTRLLRFPLIRECLAFSHRLLWARSNIPSAVYLKL